MEKPVNSEIKARIAEVVSQNSNLFTNGTNQLLQIPPEWHMEHLSIIFMCAVVGDGWAKLNIEDREAAYDTFKKMQTYLKSVSTVLKDELYF